MASFCEIFRWNCEIVSYKRSVSICVCVCSEDYKIKDRLNLSACLWLPHFKKSFKSWKSSSVQPPWLQELLGFEAEPKMSPWLQAVKKSCVIEEVLQIDALYERVCLKWYK